MRRRRGWKAVAVSHDLQRAMVVFDETHGKSAVADHLGAAVIPDAALEVLNIEQAREALVRQLDGFQCPKPLQLLLKGRGWSGCEGNNRPRFGTMPHLGFVV
jgi:hypothetical protein